MACCTFVPGGQGLSLATSRVRQLFFTNIIDRSPVISGSPLLTWMELNTTSFEETLDALVDEVFENLYQLFSYWVPQFYYTIFDIGPNRTYPVKWKILESTVTNDVVWFHRFMTNRNFDTWVYLGHGNQQELGFPNVGGGAGAMGTTITAESVSKDLGNMFGSGRFQGCVTYSRRLRTVIMQNCWSANINGNTNGGSPPVVTDWPNATGTPVGVDQTLNRVYKTAFVGFENMVSPQPVFVEALLYDWPHPELQTPNRPIVDSVAFALDLAWGGDSVYIQSTGPKVLGFAWLPYRTLYDRNLATNDFSSILFGL